MTTVKEFQLNDFEISLGVTLEDVARELPRVLIRDGFAIVGENVSPAIGSAVARCALECERVEFDGLTLGGYPRYVRTGKHVSS
jgi:hypothetical protein